MCASPLLVVRCDVRCAFLKHSRSIETARQDRPAPSTPAASEGPVRDSSSLAVKARVSRPFRAKRQARARAQAGWRKRPGGGARLLPFVMQVLMSVAVDLDDCISCRFLCTSRAPWGSRTCYVCTSWFLLCWRQHLSVRVVGSESGQLSACAERSLARLIEPARVAERASTPSVSLARGSASCASRVAQFW